MPSETDGRGTSDRSEPPLPTVTAIVVSFNSQADLPACLASLAGQRGVALETHVVDNASSDRSVETVRADFPDVRLTCHRENRGFARANNDAVEQERGRASFIAFVNPDTILPEGAVEACVNHLRVNPRAGVTATRLVNPDGTLQPSCHAFIGLRNLLGETFGAHRLLPGVRPLSSFHMPWFSHDRVLEVDWVQGAFLVVRAEVLSEVGGFDPAFFMYGEEMDWCRRVRHAGWTVVFLPEPPVVHRGGMSTKPIAGLMFVENLKGRIRFLRKHRGPLVGAAARAIIAVSVLLRFVWREFRYATHAVRRRRPDEELLLGRRMFRAAMGWVLRGLPLSSPTVAPPGARP